MLTLIVPILNEKEELNNLFSVLEKYPNNYKIIFCDGGSTDGTVDLVKNYCEKKGHLFIHEKLIKPSVLKTVLLALNSVKTQYFCVHPVDSDMSSAIHSLNFQNDYICFYKQYKPENLILKLQSFYLNRVDLNIRSNFVWTNNPIIKTSLFNKLEQYAVGFLEDIQISDFLKQNATITINKSPVFISSRRYNNKGTFRQIFTNFKVLLYYRVFKFDIDKLKAIYNK